MPPEIESASCPFPETQLTATRVRGVAFLFMVSAGLACTAWLLAAVIVAFLLVNYLAPAVVAPPSRDFPAAASFVAGEVPGGAASWRLDRNTPFHLLPTHDLEIAAMKKALAADRTNAALQDEIRTRDLALRNDYFRRREAALLWGRLLVLVAIIGLIATKIATTLARRLPVPPPAPTASQAASQASSVFVFGVLGLVVFAAAGSGVLVGLAIVPPAIPVAALVAATSLPLRTAVATSPNADDGTQTAMPASSALDRAAFTEMRMRDWVSFRNGNGVAFSDAATDSISYPTQWDTTSGDGVAWELKLPLAGNSSPILCRDRLFLTAADATRRVVLAVDTNGKKVWETEIPSNTAAFKIDGDTGYAAPTPATDGVRVYAIFATGDVVACSWDGAIVWQQSLGVPDSHYGYAASLAVWFDRVLVQYDVSDGSGGSKLLCLDGATGKTVWTVARPIPNSWSSPVVATIAGRDQIITAGDPFVIAYDAESGSELWRCKALSGDVGPSPVAFDKYVVVTNQSPRTTLIDATGSGDVTATHIVWNGSNMLPDTSSPLVVGTSVLTLSSSGYITCYQNENVRDKKAAFWELELGDGMANFYSSPTATGTLVYCFDMTQDGPRAYVIDLAKAATDDAGRLTSESGAAMIIAVNPMREPCVTSPILHQGRIYIRGSETLWCLGK